MGGGGGTGEPRENPWRKVKTNNKLNPHANVWHWARFKLGTLLGDKSSNHCTIPAPLKAGFH